MTFPTTRLDARIELAFGADLDADPSTWTWTNVGDELVETGWGITRLTTPGTPSSFVSTPDSPDFDITADLWVAASIAPDSWTPGSHNCWASHRSSATNGWLIRVEIGGPLIFVWGNAGGTTASAATVPSDFVDGQRRAIAVWLDVDDGAGGSAVHWYRSDDDGQTWVEFETDTFAGTTSILGSGIDPKIGAKADGSQRFAGDIYWVETRNGDQTGPLIYSVDFTEQTPGASSFTDPQGHVWTLNGDTEIVRPVHSQSKRLLDQALTTSRGRQDESSQTSPATYSVEFDNPDGALTPNNPESPYYPNVKVGTPLRETIPLDDAWLALPDSTASGQGVSTPDSVALSITGDFWVACDFDYRNDIAGSASQFIAGKWVETGNQRSWQLLRDSINGRIAFIWSEDGSAVKSTVFATPPPLSPLSRVVIGVHLDVDDGTGGHTVTLFVVDEWGGAWSSIAASGFSGVTSIFDSTAPVEIGNLADGTQFFGAAIPVERVHHFEMRSGDQNGTLAASPDFTVQTDGATSFDDAQGNTWTVQGDAEITDREVRLLGNVTGWELTWPWGDRSTATSPGEARVTVTANGILSRLRQGTEPLESALRRWVESNIAAFEIVGYWPLEGDAARDAVIGARATGGGDFTFGGMSEVPFGSSPLALGTEGGTTFVLRPTVEVRRPHAAALVFIPEAPSGFKSVMTIDGSNATSTLSVSGTDLRVVTVNSSGSTDTQTDPITGDLFGRWMWVTFYTDLGGVESARFSPADEPTILEQAIMFPPLGNSPFLERLIVYPNEGWGVGHVVILDDGAAPIDAWPDTAPPPPTDGWDGEEAAVRFVRLCDEEGVAADLWPTPTPAGASPLPSPSMGPQTPETFLTLLDECAEAGMAILGESLGKQALNFRPAASLYNQEPILALDASASEIANPYVSTKDNQQLRNEVTARRKGGGTTTVTTVPPPATGDRYATEVEVNVERDEDLAQQAGWRLHVGTWPENRSPSLTIDLAVAPQLIPTVVQVREGDLICVNNLPSQHPVGPDFDLIVQGWTERKTPNEWTITFNCTPGGIWALGDLDDTTANGGQGRRLDAEGSTLNAAITSTDTSIVVVTEAGKAPFVNTIDHAGEFPFDIIIGGEVMTVGSITGATSPQTFGSVTRSVNGVEKSHVAAAEVLVAYPLRLAI